VYPRWISRIGAPLIAFVLTVAPSVSTVHAVEDARKVSVVSFGLFMTICRYGRYRGE
jgi:hypothetical protein